MLWSPQREGEGSDLRGQPGGPAGEEPEGDGRAGVEAGVALDEGAQLREARDVHEALLDALERKRLQEEEEGERVWVSGGSKEGERGREASAAF